MSKSPPVSSRFLRIWGSTGIVLPGYTAPSATIGKLILWSGSRSEMNDLIAMVPDPPRLGPEVRIDVVEAEHEVWRVLLGAEAVVRHDPEVAMRSGQHRGNALNRLFVFERRQAAVRRCDELSGGRAWREGVGRKRRKALERLGGRGTMRGGKSRQKQQ